MYIYKQKKLVTMVILVIALKQLRYRQKKVGDRLVLVGDKLVIITNLATYLVILNKNKEKARRRHAN